MTSPNYTTLIDDITEIVDRIMHAYDEVPKGSAENMHLYIARMKSTELLESVTKAKVSTYDALVRRVIRKQHTEDDIHIIRKALENYHD